MQISMKNCLRVFAPQISILYVNSKAITMEIMILLKYLKIQLDTDLKIIIPSK